MPGDPSQVLLSVGTSHIAGRINEKVYGHFQIAQASLQLVAPDALDACNTLEHPDTVHVTAGQLDHKANTVRFPLSRWSVEVLSLG